MYKPRVTVAAAIVIVADIPVTLAQATLAQAHLVVQVIQVHLVAPPAILIQQALPTQVPQAPHLVPVSRCFRPAQRLTLLEQKQRRAILIQITPLGQKHIRHIVGTTVVGTTVGTTVHFSLTRQKHLHLIQQQPVRGKQTRAHPLIIPGKTRLVLLLSHLVTIPTLVQATDKIQVDRIRVIHNLANHMRRVAILTLISHLSISLARDKLAFTAPTCHIIVGHRPTTVIHTAISSGGGYWISPCRIRHIGHTTIGIAWILPAISY